LIFWFSGKIGIVSKKIPWPHGEFMNEIKEIRKKLNINQDQFAKALGVSFSTISRWETGISTPNDVQREQIEALQDLMKKKEVDTEKLRKALLTIGITGALFTAVAVGIQFSGVLGGVFSGFLSKNTGAKFGAPITGEALSKLLKKDK
jgi:DNA-binding transcriptional regulator YiaG